MTLNKKRKLNMTLRNKILISSLAAVVLMGGCGTDATKKGESAILSSVTQLQPIQLEEANTTTRGIDTDTTTVRISRLTLSTLPR